MPKVVITITELPSGRVRVHMELEGKPVRAYELGRLAMKVIREKQKCKPAEEA